MRTSNCGNYVAVPSYRSFDIDNESPEDLILNLEKLLEKYPYNYEPTYGKSYQVTHCTLSLLPDDCEDYYSIVVQEWRSITEDERVDEINRKNNLLNSNKVRELEKLKTLMKKYKGEF